MKSFLVEVYAPGTSELSVLAAQARAAAHDGVRYVRSIFIPEDELCFHLFEGSPSSARRARRAAADVDRGRPAGGEVEDRADGRPLVVVGDADLQAGEVEFEHGPVEGRDRGRAPPCRS